MNDLETLRQAWGQPEPPSPGAHLAARTALLQLTPAHSPARRHRPARLPGRWAVAGVAGAAAAVVARWRSCPPDQPPPPVTPR